MAVNKQLKPYLVTTGRATRLVDLVEFFRSDAARKLAPTRRSELGQFMTPATTAVLMASMFDSRQQDVHLLDAGAGVGSLTAAYVQEMCGRTTKPKRIRATAYEVDGSLAEYLGDTLRLCREACERVDIEFQSTLFRCDFISEAVRMLRNQLFDPIEPFDCAILNPPYKKINTDSDTRRLLGEVGVETSNLYTGFLALVSMLLGKDGELVAITPRSFCNGPYFKPFRKFFIETLILKRIRVFESRQVAFKEDDVLQENVIFQAIKSQDFGGSVIVTSSQGPEDPFVSERIISYSQLIHRNDPEYFIRIVPDQIAASVASHMRTLTSTLRDLCIEVSTGRVVDFRAKKFLRAQSNVKTVPLIYPRNLEDGLVQWPKPGGNKPHSMAVLPGISDLLVQKGTYVLVKRFSAKEENRRVVAALYDPERITSPTVGFENHLNYFHSAGRGLSRALAKGLVLFLNSTIVDLYFRQFSGHTQVNATDLRNLRYPTAQQLEKLGAAIGDVFPDQDEIDRLVQNEVFPVDRSTHVPDPVRAKNRIDEAQAILKQLGLPREQHNERSALTLLALLDLKPDTPWADAQAPLRGITPMMNFFEEQFGKVYAPNTRETVRRQTIHQFLDAGMVVSNPDDAERPTNSPNAVYQIEVGLLELVRTYGTPEWNKALETYLASVETLKEKYAQERKMQRIPIQISPDEEITLSPGGQNILVEKIVADFTARFTPGGVLIYVGDTDEKWAYFNRASLQALGGEIDVHGKMPDVIVYLPEKNWLVLIEAVTSHGPVDPKRRLELKRLFQNCTAGLVFVTAFLDRRAMTRFLSDISWETEVWVADAPDHLIHFNGERFLGPYE